MSSAAISHQLILNRWDGFNPSQQTIRMKASVQFFFEVKEERVEGCLAENSYFAFSFFSIQFMPDKSELTKQRKQHITFQPDIGTSKALVVFGDTIKA